MKHLLLVLLLGLSLPSFAQTLNLQQKYNLPVFASQPLSATYTVATAQKKYPGYWTWIKWMKATDTEAMSVNEVAAAWNDAVWGTDGFVAGNINSAYPQNGCQSRAVLDASGIYYAATNIPLTLGLGEYIGGGTGNYTETSTANGGPGTTGGTRIAIDHANWLSRLFPDRNAMQSASWGDESFYGYSESFVVRGFRLEGGMDNKVHDPSFQSSGIAIWDSGETSRLEYNFCSNFNDGGIHNVRGTPTIIDGCSTFSNRRYGIWLDGGSLSTIAIYSPSGDDNGPGDGTPGALIGGSAGYGRPGGGTLSIVSAKAETGNVQGRMNGKQRLMDLTGFWNVTITGGQVFSSVDKLQEAISIDFQTYKGNLDVRGLNLIGFASLAKITSNGKTVTYKTPGDYTPVSFVINESGVVWASRDIGQPSPVPPVDPTPAPSDALYTGGPWTVNTSTYFVAVDVEGATSATITFTPKSIGYGQILGTGANKPSLQMYPDGYLYFAGKKVSTVQAIAGKPQTITVTFPKADITGLFQTAKGQGGAQQGDFSSIVLR